MKREISAGIIIYRKTHDGPRFLLLYHGGRYWNFAKGHIEEEESAERAALREVREETGLGANDLAFNHNFKVYDKYFFKKGKEKIFKIVIYYLAETRNPNVKISFEHQGYGWFLYRDAAHMLPYQNLKNNLKKAHDTISKHSLSSHK